MKTTLFWSTTWILLLGRVSHALPTGAGNCAGGRAAVGVTHLQGDVTDGTLDDGGLTMTIGDQLLQMGRVTKLPVGEDLPMVLNATARPLRGFLIRGEDRSDDNPADTTEAFSSSGGRAKVAKTVCINAFHVGGLTHTSNNQKRFVGGTFRMDQVVGELQIDVTVVMKNRNGESIFYYSGFVVSIVDTVDGQDAIEEPIAVDETNTEDYVFDFQPGLPLIQRGFTCSDEFPCGECEGDCNKNSNCNEGLECFFRPDDTKIPGCLGRGVAGVDYCYKPRNDTLRLRSVECSEDRPCDACQGSCSSEADCDDGLSCFIRPDLTPVPGCEGKGIARRNYCYEPPKTEEPIPILNATECNRTNPCELCQGECNRHSDCKDDLQCFFRPDLTPIPGCSSSFLGVKGRNYCAMPQENTLMLRETPCSTFMPCDECLGECSHFSQCKGALECFRRSDMEEVPGCGGGGISGKNFCYDPEKDLTIDGPAEPFPSVLPTPMPTPPRPTTDGPVQPTTDRPTKAPSTPRPTRMPVLPTPLPTPPRPTPRPTPKPTRRPQPTPAPTTTPEPTAKPTRRPRPTLNPTAIVQEEVVIILTQDPTPEPSPRPTPRPVQLTPMPTAPRPTLRPTRRQVPEPTPRPTRRPRPTPRPSTLSPTPQPTRRPRPTPSPTLDDTTGQNLSDSGKTLSERATPCRSGNPCNECEGDCQSDNGCRGNLQCFRRPDNTPVPGCNGLGVSATNYCAINPNLEDRPQPTAPRPTSSKAPPTPMPTPQKPKPTPLPFVDDNNEDNQMPQLREKNNGRECSMGEPCGHCFGDCDSDNECAGILRCFFRSAFEPVPGCSGSGTFGMDYCAYDPRVSIGNSGGNGQNNGGSNNQLLNTRNRVCTRDDPCGECQGDCDSNGECAGVLQCFFRVGLEQVPGCSGSGVPARDYCAFNPNASRVRRRDLEESEIEVGFA